MSFDDPLFIECKVTIQISRQSFQVWALISQLFTPIYSERRCNATSSSRNMDNPGARICMVNNIGKPSESMLRGWGCHQALTEALMFDCPLSIP